MPEGCKKVLRTGEGCGTIKYKNVDLSNLLKMFWIPPLAIGNLKEATVDKLFNEDMSAQMDYCSGEFYLRGSFDVKINCQVKYEAYPFDTQRCLFQLNTR